MGGIICPTQQNKIKKEIKIMINTTKIRELTISDIKELTEGKKVRVNLVSAMLIELMDAIVTVTPDSGEDGTITVSFADGMSMKLDASREIESMRGNEREIEIEFPNTIGFLYIYIGDDAETNEDPVINQNELRRYIKDRLERVSKLTVEDIDLILNLEMEFLNKRGIAS